MQTIYSITFILAVLSFVDVLPRVQSKVFTIPLEKKSITRREWHKYNRRDIKNMQLESDPKNIAYFGNVGFGPKGKEQVLPIMFDTGSADLWVMSVDCTSLGCSNKPKKYDWRLDNDYVDLQRDFDMEYIVGEAKGKDSTTTLNFNGFEIPKQRFGLVNTVSDDHADFSYVGIMGMARGPGANNQVTPIRHLIDQNRLDHHQYSFLFGREADNGVSELTIGGTNPDRIDGDITWIDNELFSAGRWLIEVDALRVNGEAIDFGGDDDDDDSSDSDSDDDEREMFIDTGYDKINMSLRDARKVYAKIPVAKELDGGKFSMPCDNHDFVISLKIMRKVWPMDARDFIVPAEGDQCVGAIEAAHRVGDDDQWVVGTAFLKNVYTVFDFREDEVGFAKIKAPAPKQNEPLKRRFALGQNKTSDGSGP